MDEKNKERSARLAVAARVRRYFAELKSELDKDTEDFFQRVMRQAGETPGDAHSAR